MKATYFLFVFVFLTSLVAFSQQKFEKAEQAFAKGNYATAQKLYEEYLRQLTKPEPEKKAKAYFYIARCQQQQFNYATAQKYFERVLAEGITSPDIYLYYAQLQTSMGKKDEAVAYYQKYDSLSGNAALKSTADSVYLFANCFQHPNTFWNVQLQKDVSTLGTEAALCFADSNTIYYATTGTENGTFSQLFKAQIVNQSLQNPLPVLELNKSVKGLAVDQFNQKIYFLIEEKENTNIYTSSYNGNKWAKPKKIKIQGINAPIQGFCLANEGTRIYFSAQLEEDSWGGKDIWFTDYKAGVWTSPTNAGEKVNTSKDELSPFVFNDSLLFFSSNGWAQSYGGFDIYVQHLQNAQSTPTNLFLPVNSTYEEIGFALNSTGTKAAFLSNRKSNNSTTDIFFIDSLLPVNMVFGSIKSKNTQQNINGVVVEMLENNNRIEADTNTNQHYNIFYPTHKNGTLKFSKYSFFSFFLAVNTTDSKTTIAPFLACSQQNIQLENLEINKAYAFKELFPPKLPTTEISAQGKTELSRLVDFLQENAWAKVTLQAYCSFGKNQDYNRLLNTARMNTVVLFLQEQNINPNRCIQKLIPEKAVENNTGEQYTMQYTILSE